MNCIKTPDKAKPPHIRPRSPGTMSGTMYSWSWSGASGEFAVLALAVWTVVAIAFGTTAADAEPPHANAPAQRQAVQAPHSDPLPEGERTHAATIDIPWIIASEDEPWTVALAAPVAAHLRNSPGPGPLVMAITSPPTREAEWLLSQAPGRRPIVLATSAELKLGATLQKRSPEVLQIGSDPSEASATVAKRFWNHSREVVVAMADDPEAVILGSALAAGLDVPILLCEQEEAGAAVSAALKDLSVARILVAVSDLKKTPRWIRTTGRLPYEILPPRALQHRLIAALDRKGFAMWSLPEPRTIGRKWGIRPGSLLT